MVFEFTDTQGVMGMHYARHDGEAEEVAVALNEQYMPRLLATAYQPTVYQQPSLWRISWTLSSVSSVLAKRQKAVTHLHYAAHHWVSAYHC